MNPSYPPSRAKVLTLIGLASGLLSHPLAVGAPAANTANLLLVGPSSP
jgi:hypothetical protein